MKHVIVGAGPAGVVAAETLHKSDRNAEIHLIGGEPEPPYSRMAIPYLLEGNIAEDGTYLRKTAGHYDALAIQYSHGRVETVSAGDNSLTIEGGEKIGYDRLLIATGARPMQLPVPGIDLAGVHNCWTLADAREIAKLAAKDSNVVLIGAGFIGCIILESLLKLAGNLSVVEMEERMVSRMMDDAAGGMLKRWCESKNVEVLTSSRVSAIEAASDGDGDKNVVLEDGRKLNAHLVVLAVGVAPNMDFLDGSGVATDDGILVDEHLATNVENIFAAGDVAQGPDFSTGGHMVHAIQPTAVEHGRIAALNMAGHSPVYKGSLNMNVLATAGLVSSSFGKWDGVSGGDSAAATDEENYKYLCLQFQEDHLIGALGIGMTEHIGVMRGLITSRTPLGDWKDKLLASPNRVMEAYVAQSQL
jgi:NAD(P)H-nitrite reductase large subunit